MTHLQDNYAIELRHITKRFGPVVANDDISLGLRRGEILALLGENGSGKTTLMNMLSGIYYPDEGEIYVDGKWWICDPSNNSATFGTPTWQGMETFNGRYNELEF